MEHIKHDIGGGLKTEQVRRRHILLKAGIIGLVAGLTACAFRLSLRTAENLREEVLSGVAENFGKYFGLPAAILIGATLAGIGLWLVRRFAPETTGSGIPHLKSVILDEAQLRWQRVLPVKFIAGVLGIGGGLALGREGPTIQMGGAVGLMISKAFRVTPGEGERKALISAGAAAGLSAAFNAPLAGVMFVLEELHGHFAPVMFVAAFIASVTADIVCRLLLGASPVFATPGIVAPGLDSLPLAALLGILCGFGGIIFNRVLLWSLDRFDRLRKVPVFAVGALAGAVAGGVGWFYPGLAGSGAALSEHVLAGGIAGIGTLSLLMLARFALTMWSFGSGSAGGIFAPILVIGALGGLALGQGVHAVLPALAPHPEIFAVLGMGGLLAAVVRAPLTSIVLIIELTAKYEFMLPLLVCLLLAYGVAEWRGCEPIYDSLRVRSLRKAKETA